MAVKVGINGFGRIGRNVFRAATAAGADLEFVAVNDLDRHRPRSPTCSSTTRSSAASRARSRSAAARSSVDGKELKVLSERDPAALPWGDLGVDVVIESTGFFTARDDAAKHLEAGAKKVIISAPAKEPDVTVALGVNFDSDYDPREPRRHLQRLLHDQLPGAAGEGAARRVRDRAGADDDDPRLHRRPAPAGHAAQGPAPGARRGAQPDPDHDRRRQGGRPGAAGAERQAERVLDAGAGPDRLGRRPRLHDRRPARRPTQINAAVKAAAEGPLKGILAYTEDPIVSTDIVGDPHSSIFDAGQTMVIGDGRMVKAVAWYDNEWGYSNRCVELAGKVL